MAIEDENNDYPDTISKILPLKPGASTGDTFYGFNDHDWVPIQLVAGQSYNLIIRGGGLSWGIGLTPIEITFAPNVAFHDSFGKAISIPGITHNYFEADYSSGIAFTFTAQKSRTFYVDMSFDFGTGSNLDSYSWSLKFNKSIDQYASNASTTGQLVFSSDHLQAISSTWESLDGSDFVRPDADWFKTSLQAGQSYTVALASKTNASLFTNNLSIVDSYGKVILPSQKSVDSISFIAPKKGVYYINVHLDKEPFAKYDAKQYGYIVLGQQNIPIGTSQNDVLKGAGGADLLYGRAGNDTLIGNAGKDILNGGAGNDKMIGGSGNDTYYVDNIRDVVKETDINKTAIDSVFSSVSYTLPNNVENLTLRLSPQDQESIIGVGNGLNNSLSSFVPESTLKGGAGNDTLTSSYTATLFGEAGNDKLIGSGHLVGGTGKDFYTIHQVGERRATVEIGQGDSLPGSFDVIKNLSLARLDLKSNAIANNTVSANGKDVGMFHSHHIKQGLISFGNLDVYNKPLTVSSATVADAIKYVQANITKPGDTVAFISGKDTYVFQDGGAIDTLVQLVGVKATGINDTAQGSIYLV